MIWAQHVQRKCRTHHIIGATPRRALQQTAERHVATHFSKGVRLSLVIRPIQPCKQTQVLARLLLERQAHTHLGVLLTHLAQIRRAAGGLAECDGVIKAAHARLVAPAHQPYLAVLAEQRVALFQFHHVTVVLHEGGIQCQTIRFDRLQEAACARSPAELAVDVFQRDAPVVATRIGGVVERRARHERPVQELRARIVRILHTVKYIQHRHVAHRQHYTALVDHIGKLIEVGVDLFGIAAQAPGLAQESTGAVQRRVGARHLRQLSVGRATQAVQLGECLTHDDFRVEVELGALPQPHTQIERSAERVADRAVASQAVVAAVRRLERGLGLPHPGRLAVETEAVIQLTAGDRQRIGGRGRSGRILCTGSLGRNRQQCHHGQKSRTTQCSGAHQNQRTHRNPNVLQHREKQHETSPVRFYDERRHEPTTVLPGDHERERARSHMAVSVKQSNCGKRLVRRTRTSATTRRAYG